MRKIRSGLMAAVALVLTTSGAWAGSQSFDWLVDQVPEMSPGTVDSTLIQSYVPKGHGAGADGTVATGNLTRTAVRTMYGLTDHVALMYQLNLARPNGQSYQYEGSEFGAHFRFYEGEGWKLGGAVEIEWQRAPGFVEDALGLDLHPIVERDFGPVTVLLNPIVEKSLVGPDQGRGMDAGYAAQVLYHFMDRYSAGLEFYGDKGRILDGGSPHTQDHYIMPVVNGSFGGFDLSAGPGFGLTSASDRVVLKFNLRYAFAMPHRADASRR